MQSAMDHDHKDIMTMCSKVTFPRMWIELDLIFLRVIESIK